MPTIERCLRRRAETIVLAAALLAAACGDGVRPDATVVTRDSVGIAIIDNAAPASDLTPFTIDSTPIIDLGGGGLREEFSGGVFPRWLSDGRIAVANTGSNEIRVFGADGAWQQNIGRPGSGPGEFESLAWLDAGVGDTLRTYDWGLLRVSVFAPNGAVQRSMWLGTPDQIGSHRVVGVLGDGSIIAQRENSVSMESQRSTGRDTALLLRFDAEGKLADSLGRLASHDVLIERTPNTMRLSPLPFGKDLHVVARGTRIYVGTADSPELSVLRPDGSVERIVRWSAPPVPVTADVIQRYLESIRAAWPSSDTADRDAYIASQREAPFPKFKPAYEGLLVSTEGHAWVRRAWDPGVASETHDVFAPDGRWLGAVALPARFSPRQITSDVMVGVWRDADDVQHVRVYSIRRAIDW